MLAFRFGPANEQLFGCLHLPLTAPARQHGVLLCNPFGQEAIRGQRLVRILAERLARQGFHVFRFDYFAAGDSDGDDAAGSLEHWTHDIQLADSELRSRSGNSAVSWVGFRLGATLAAKASMSIPAAPKRLVLWEPVLDGKNYIAQLADAHFQVIKRDYLSRWSESSDLAKAITATVGSEILGYPLTDALRTELEAISINDMSAARAERIHVFDTSELANGLGTAENGREIRHTTIAGAIEWATIEAPSSAIVSNEGIGLIIGSLTGEV